VTSYRDYAEQPDVQVGWDLELDDVIEAPAYEGLLDLAHARVAEAG
jgi:hypothetical protein